MKKILFHPMTKFTDLVLDIPKPSSYSLPGWYKKIPLEAEGYDKPGLSDFNSKASNLTIKGCTPFLDALTAGYMVTLPADLEVKKAVTGDLYFNWRSEIGLISLHTPEQHPGLPNIVHNQSLVVKFSFNFTIRTPKGYSCLFTHPLNRNELPFRTFSGIVDTDGYTQEVQFPFQLNQEITEPMIIEAGTPICQIIPFKREGWKMSFKARKQKEIQNSRLFYGLKVLNIYKDRYWNKKSWK